MQGKLIQLLIEEWMRFAGLRHFASLRMTTFIRSLHEGKFYSIFGGLFDS
jgi:hypothetical protein